MKFLAIAFIQLYQWLHLGFFLGTCRFHPTCSQYAIEAFEKKNLITAMALVVFRLIRCQPFCRGGYDPLP